MEYFLMGIITALNLIFIYWKFQKARYEDAILDIIAFFIIVKLLGSSTGGMFVGMVASLTISIYLFFNPPKFNTKGI